MPVSIPLAAKCEGVKFTPVVTNVLELGTVSNSVKLKERGRAVIGERHIGWVSAILTILGHPHFCVAVSSVKGGNGGRDIRLVLLSRVKRLASEIRRRQFYGHCDGPNGSVLMPSDGMSWASKAS